MSGAPAGLVPNPIVTKFVRERLRPKHLISWGIVTLTLTGFVCAIVYLVQTEQELATPRDAARVMILPVIIIQAVILMLLGTGAVATGVARERDLGLLDYQRMTPMAPVAKLIGYLFGLPVREYALFALTLPFLAFGVIRGGFPLLTVAHFYLIFFSSVIVYHMTGITAGMISARPWRAGLISQGMVLLLYFVLPNLSFLGLTFFEFLTIRPALLGMIQEEIERSGSALVLSVPALTALDTFRAIPFYGVHLHPSVYTMLVQGGLIVTLWVVAYRRWRDDAALLFSKAFGVVFFAGASVFLLGSVWPILHDDGVFAGLIRTFINDRVPDAELAQQEEATVLTAALLTVALGVLGALAIFVTVCTTPDRAKATAGLRRARRAGLGRVPWWWDAASSAPVVVASVVVTGLVYALLVRFALSTERFIVEPSVWRLALPAVYVGAVVLFMRAGLARFGMRAFSVSVFLLWMVPFFSSVLLGAAFELQLPAAYAALPCPPAALAIMTMGVVESGLPAGTLDGGPDDIVASAVPLAVTGIGLYAVLAVATGVLARRDARRRREAVFEGASERSG